MVEWRNSYAWLNQKIAEIRAMGWNRKTLTAAGVALGLTTFGVGFLTAKATEGGGPRTGSGVAVSEVMGSLFGKPRDARAPRASDKKPDGFTVWRDKLNVAGNAPRACLQMTKALDPSKSYGDYVLISPDLPTPPAVTVNGDELCVSGFGFSDRRITLLKGLPAKSGETLEANISRDFSFGEKPPYVGFAGNGVILPREDADGVAVETVNVSNLAFEVWRIADRNLVRKSIAAPSPTAEGDWADDWGDDSPDDEGSVIWKGDVKVRAGNGERVTTVFPLGSVLKELKPGAYVIKVRDASGGRDKLEDDHPAQARRWILFTDMALTTYSGSKGLDVVVRSLGSAHAMSGVNVTLVAQNGEELARAKSDGSGRVSFAKTLLKGTGALTPKMVMAYGPDSDFTALDINSSPMDLSNKGVGGRQDEDATGGRSGPEDVDGFLYTDRGIYRPGENVHLVALVRDAESLAVKERKGSLVLYRPSGVEAYRFGFAKTPEGFAGADIVLPKTAPRGQWRAELRFEGSEDASGSTSFAVEDFAPQRLGVDIKAESERPLMGEAEVRPVRVNARFLYGATGSGLQVTGEARLRADPNPFPAYKDYRFGNEVTPFAEKYIDLPETTTDANGDALYPFAASQAGDTDQPVVALVTSSVFEPGGRPVRESETLRIRTRALYLGAKIENGPDAPNGNPQLVFNVIGVNAKGEKVAANNVRVKLISENVRYDWYQADGKWRWRRTTQDVVVSDKVMALNANTGGNFTKNLEWGDYRLEIEAPDQKAKTVVRFASGWGQAASDVETPDFVRLSTGTRAYVQGDTVALTIKAPYRGEAQIAVATDKLIDLKTVSVGEGGTTIRLNTNAAWGGGAYIMVSVIQPRDPVDASKPRRAMGLVYVPLDPKSRKLTVDLDLKNVPQKPVSDKAGAYIEVPIKVGNMRFGERAHVSLAVVDQGIVNLTKFKAPDPSSWYFGKKALGVEYRDDYGRLLDPNLGAPAALNYGGDQLGGEGLSTTPIKTVALWSGIVETGLDGKSKIRLPIPKFSGELKVMAVAWTDGAVGSASDKLIVREPVVTQLDLPRFMAPGDKALATLEVHNVDGKPDLYSVVVTGLKGIFVNISKMLQLKVGERVAQTIPVDAPQTAGVGSVHVAVKSGGYAFEDDYDIETRNGWGTTTKLYTEQQQPNAAFTPPGWLLDGYQPGSVRVQVSYSPFKGIDPGPIAAHLSRYPYGCTEQITSAAYPWVYVSGSLTDEKQAKRADWMLKQAVSKILDRQAADGAFGLWRAGDGEADGWLGAYATDFLIEAQRQGAFVPKDAMDKALNGMRQISKPEGTSYISYRRDVPDYWYFFNWTAKDVSDSMRSRASAYALYVLAKAGSGDLARLRWYLDVQFAKEKSPLARAQIAAALARMGDKARARLGFQKAIETLGYKEDYNWYQSPLRDLSGVIALAYESGFNDIGQNLAKRLETEIKNPDDLNTQEQAQLLRAASFMLKASGPLNVEQSGAYPISAKGTLLRYDVGSLSKSKFINRGSGPVWRTVSVTGAPLNSPPAEMRGFSVDKVYYSMQGARLDPSHIVQGQKVIVAISGRSSLSQTRPTVIDDALPAGLEIEMLLSNEDTKSGPFSFVGTLTSTLAQEARDDRYIAAINTSSSNGFAVAYIARAVTQGDYYLPGVEVKDFYRADLSARTAGSRMQVAGR
jgi:alpha-2-macroglobulin